MPARGASLDKFYGIQPPTILLPSCEILIPKGTEQNAMEIQSLSGAEVAEVGVEVAEVGAEVVKQAPVVAKPEKEMLRIYYGSHMPMQTIGLWLGFGRAPMKGSVTSKTFIRREFSFTRKDIFTGNDIFMRFKSFEDISELKSFLEKRSPERIDLGAIYSDKPDQKLLGSVPESKEFTIDIDLTDMGGKIFSSLDDPSAESFSSSWTVLSAAVKVLDAALREDFGFSQILWVFSGRRGVHCWVADERARKMTTKERGAVASYLQLPTSFIAGNEALHPHLGRAVSILEKTGLFTRMLEEQKWLLKERRETVLSMLEDVDLREEIELELDGLPWNVQLDQERLWRRFKEIVVNPSNQASKKNRAKRQQFLKKKKMQREEVGKNIINSIIIGLTYPVLDINVSCHLNHLLKMPFAVHPSTGYICVPVDPTDMEHMEVGELPTLYNVCMNSKILQPYVRVMKEQFVKPVHMHGVRKLCNDF